MLSSEYLYVKEEILKLTEVDFTGRISIENFDGVSVKFDGTDAVIGCQSKVQFARGIFLLAQNYKNGAFEIEQKPNFEILASMLDVSRNGVFTIPSIKYWVTATAALGYTHFLLYMEDVYELEGYPRFGYMRGRYTKEELKEINRICEALGVEVIPTVQSLGHMAQYLQWGEASAIKDTDQCLLVDEPKTYVFLEKAFALMRECFPTSKLLNVVLDEAFDLGTGKFMKLHGYEPRSKIFGRHAERVFDLCKKYGFRARMAGDMFFRMKGNGNYYDNSVELTPDDAKNIPADMLIGYWDYYHTEKSKYHHYIKQHKNLGHDIVLGGAVWTWEGYVEDTVFTWQASVPFLEAAIESGEKYFFAYTFGDHGSETNFIRSIGSFAIFSEYCYRGIDCKKEDICAVSTFLTKMPYSHKFDIGKIHSDYHEDYRLAKKLMLGDVFYNLVNIKYDYDKVLNDLTAAEEKCAEFMKLNDRYRDYYEYCYFVAKLTREKLYIINSIRPAYQSNDRNCLWLLAKEKLPEFINDMTEFIEIFKKEWLKYKKPNGLEVVLLRLAASREQAYLRSQQIISYLNQEIDRISELDEELIENNHKVWETRLFTTSVWHI